MGYGFDINTGEQFKPRTSEIETCGEWCPYYNREGKYVGCAYGVLMNGKTLYYNPFYKTEVPQYWMLDW